MIRNRAVGPIPWEDTRLLHNIGPLSSHAWKRMDELLQCLVEQRTLHNRVRELIEEADQILESQPDA